MSKLTDIVITEGQFYLIMAGFIIWSLGMFLLGLAIARIERRKDEEVATWINGSSIAARWPKSHLQNPKL